MINKNRYYVDYAVGSSVLFWDPKSTVSKVDADRPRRLPTEPHIKNVPTKWKYFWSGPHFISAKISATRYTMYHTVRRKQITVHVDSLQPAPEVEGVAPVMPVDKPTIPQILPPLPRPAVAPAVAPDQKLRILHGGDLCALWIDSETEPLVIARYLSPIDGTPGGLRFQWCGSYEEYRYPDPEERLCKMTWDNGWYQPDTRFYWKTSRDHGSHVPFTNQHTGNDITAANILYHDFGLVPKTRKIPAVVSAKILRAWRHFTSKASAATVVPAVTTSVPASTDVATVPVVAAVKGKAATPIVTITPAPVPASTATVAMTASTSTAVAAVHTTAAAESEIATPITATTAAPVPIVAATVPAAITVATTAVTPAVTAPAALPVGATILHSIVAPTPAVQLQTAMQAFTDIEQLEDAPDVISTPHACWPILALADELLWPSPQALMTTLPHVSPLPPAPLVHPVPPAPLNAVPQRKTKRRWKSYPKRLSQKKRNVR